MSEYKAPPEHLRTVKYLAQLHEMVKSHPYRLNQYEKYLKSYKELLWEMTDIWYYVIRATKYSVAKGMGHDLNGAIGNIGRENYKYSAENDAHVENCISVVHEFVSSGTVPVFYTLSPNIDSLFHFDGPFIAHVWNEELQGFYIRVPRNKIPEFRRRVTAWMNRITEARKGSEFNEKFIRDWTEIIENVEKYNQK